MHQYFTPVSSYSFMLMTLFYIPCLATIAVIKREIGMRWAIIASVWSIFLGWIVATIFFQLSKIF